jgi:hypothetical protein
MLDNILCDAKVWGCDSMPHVKQLHRFGDELVFEGVAEMAGKAGTPIAARAENCKITVRRGKLLVVPRHSLTAGSIAPNC